MTDAPATPTPISARHWQPQLGALGAIVTDLDDIAQAIRVILNTPLRSDPLRPEFGADLMPYIDMPVTLAAMHLSREARVAVERWEPRARVTDVTVSYGEAAAGRVRITVTWALAPGLGIASERTTEVVLL